MAVTLSGLLIADPSAASVTLNSVGSGEVSVLEVLPAAVAGRFLFYNNSSFDQSGNSNAVATDKQALLPGGAGVLRELFQLPQWNQRCDCRH